MAYSSATPPPRRALKILPALAAALRRRKLPVRVSCRVDEAYALVGGQWKYLYRAVDKLGLTADSLLNAHREVAAAPHFFERAIALHEVPASITIDKSSANTAAVCGQIVRSGVHAEPRQSKYLRRVVGGDQRAIKRRSRSMMGFKSFWSAVRIIADIEAMHMIKPVRLPRSVCAADRFFSLATE